MHVVGGVYNLYYLRLVSNLCSIYIVYPPPTLLTQVSSTSRARHTWSHGKQIGSSMPPKTTKKGFVVVRGSDSEDDVSIPQSRTVHLSNTRLNIIQTTRSPQKRLATRRSPSPVYEWHASVDYDTVDLVSGDNATGKLDHAEEELHTVAAKVAAKRYPTSVRGILGIGCCALTSSQDAPLREWGGDTKSDPGFREEYLAEMLRLEGRGDAGSQPGCMSCTSTDGAYRCEDCMGMLLECSSCCLKRHKVLPLHVIQVGILALLTFFS